MSNIINEMYKTEEEKLYIDASRAYNDGDNIISDKEFDLLEEKLRKEGSDIVNYTHDQLAHGDLDEETFSIQPIYTWEEVIQWMKSTGEEEFCLSQKIDGVNAKVFFSLEAGLQARSRARDGRSAFDYTEALKHIFPQQTENIGVVGEVFLPEKYLFFFKEKYDKQDKFKLPRSAAIMLLRCPQDYTPEDLQLLQFRAFSITLPTCSKVQEFEVLRDKGFLTPKYSLVTIDTVKNLYEELGNSSTPLDGLVLEVNSKTFIPTSKGKYLSSQIAIKLDSFGDKKHSAVVTDIHIEPSRGNFGIVLGIEPYVMPDGATITRVNAFNIGIILRMKIQKGSVIEFYRKSNGMTVLSYGDNS